MWKITFILLGVLFHFIETVMEFFALPRAMYPLLLTLEEGRPQSGELTLIKEERRYTVTRNGITLGTCYNATPLT